MRIILAVAGNTFRRRIGEMLVGVTRLALHARMGAQKRELRCVVVELRRFPVLLGVTGGAVLSEASLVHVILGVTGRAL